ncbi:GntR family transcriptional regulator [Paraglaciecola sp.]|uniref:GntR family transcriptional regulator n=1 Tax=Paraglaciecola sp. TaxID=1920173 RepID=UPI003EF7A8B7
MSNNTYLFKQSCNSMLNHIVELPDDQNEMATDIELTKLLNVSRTTVRSCVEHLSKLNIIKRDGFKKIVLRDPESRDFFDIKDKDLTKDIQIEKYFLSLINTGKLLPGDKFSELNLAKNSGCTTVTVREFLIKFSNNGLIEKSPRGRWKMVKFDKEFAHELASFREMIEMRALIELIQYPREHSVWRELQDLLLKHQAISLDMENRYLEFPDLDRELHMILMKSGKNRVTQQFFNIVSFVCHYHYQWDKTGELERFKIAVNEHMELLHNLLTHNDSGAILALERHLQTAEETLLRCLNDLDK